MTIRRFAVFSLLAGLAGCGDLTSLEEEPRAFLSEQQFYTDAADAEAAVIAAYGAFQDYVYYRGEYFAVLETMADYADGIGSFAPGGSYQCDETCARRLHNGWNSMWKGIDRANNVLANVPDIDMPEATKQRFLGEASFVRALNYYNLVRGWGGVPLRLEPSSGFDALAAPRATADEVYARIVAVLEFAEASLPTSAPNGRATTWAAKTLLADVLLTREQWADAAAKAREVMESGQFSLATVEQPDDFLQIFGPEVGMSSEEIFDIPMTRLYGTRLPAFLAPANAPYAVRGVGAIFGDMASFIATWDPADLRMPFNLYVGEDTVFLSPAQPMRFKKFRDPESSGRDGHANDIPILRLADALLIFAEATAMAGGGPNTEAYEAVNRIRRRAYGLPLDAPAPGVDLPEGLGAEAFRDAVIQERGYEFLIEGKRYWDLKRSGKLPEAIEAVGEPYDPRYMLWPLPQEELDANDALTAADQNPGW